MLSVSRYLPMSISSPLCQMFRGVFLDLRICLRRRLIWVVQCGAKSLVSSISSDQSPSIFFDSFGLLRDIANLGSLDKSIDLARIQVEVQDTKSIPNPLSWLSGRSLLVMGECESLNTPDELVTHCVGSFHEPSALSFSSHLFSFAPISHWQNYQVVMVLGKDVCFWGWQGMLCPYWFSSSFKCLLLFILSMFPRAFLSPSRSVVQP